jgi:hypothetical protein
MKGTLYKKIMPSGWFVAFATGYFGFHRTELPLHPDEDELKMVMILNVPVCEFEGKEVEFEIVDYGFASKYAKLIPLKEQQKQETLYTEEQIRKAYFRSSNIDELIQSLKQHK